MKLNEIKEELSKLQNEKEALNTELTGTLLTKADQLKEHLNQLRSKKTDLNNSINELSSSKNRSIESLAKIEEEINELNSQIEALISNKKKRTFNFSNGTAVQSLPELREVITKLSVEELKGYIDRGDFSNYLKSIDVEEAEITIFQEYVREEISKRTT